jgi:hypothetical protein
MTVIVGTAWCANRGSGSRFKRPWCDSSNQRDGTQLHHVTVDGVAEWIAWWDAQEAMDGEIPTL